MKHQWIEKRLRQLGLSKKDLARALDLPAPRISEILNNKRQLKLCELLPLAQTLQFSQSTLLSLLQSSDQQPTPVSPGADWPQNAHDLHDIWVIGHQPASLTAEITLWPTEQHYLIHLPLPNWAANADHSFWALEHRSPNGDLNQLSLHLQNQTAPRPTDPKNITFPAALKLNFNTDE